MSKYAVSDFWRKLLNNWTVWDHYCHKTFILCQSIGLCHMYGTLGGHLSRDQQGINAWNDGSIIDLVSFYEYISTVFMPSTFSLFNLLPHLPFSPSNCFKAFNQQSPLHPDSPMWVGESSVKSTLTVSPSGRGLRARMTSEDHLLKVDGREITGGGWWSAVCVDRNRVQVKETGSKKPSSTGGWDIGWGWGTRQTEEQGIKLLFHFLLTFLHHSSTCDFTQTN